MIWNLCLGPTSAPAAQPSVLPIGLGPTMAPEQNTAPSIPFPQFPSILVEDLVNML